MDENLTLDPLVSIITVTYNSEKYIHAAIESVLAQDYYNIEYIILDDASKDATWDIICSYDDFRIKAIGNRTNIGEYNNRNKGIQLATGKYLIFIDGDDFIYPHAISFFTKMMEAFPSAGMAISRNYENNIIYPVELTPEQTISTHFFTRSLLAVSLVSTFFKTQALKDVGGLSTAYRTGDEFIRLVVGSKYNTLLINYGLTWHRETPGQATKIVNESGVGIAEEWIMFEHLNSDQILPLSDDLIVLKRASIKKRLARFLLKSLLLLDFKKYFQISALTNFKIIDLIHAFSRLKAPKGYLSNYNSDKPLMLPPNRNPFSRNNN